MTATAVLVRGVNVGGNNRLPMADLRGVLTDLGGRGVATYLQSGNAVADLDPSALGARVEDGLRQRTGLDVRVMVRTVEELAAVVAANPFPERARTPKQLHVAFYDAQPDAALVRQVGTDHGDDRLAVGDRVIYLSYAGGSHDSPVLPALRRIGGVVTTRNWATVTALLTMAEALAAG